MTWYSSIDWQLLGFVALGILAMVGLVCVCFILIPRGFYILKRNSLGSKAIRIFYVGENKKIESDLVSIGTKDNSNVISYKDKSFIFDPKYMFTLPRTFGPYKKEACIFYYYNSCYPVDIQSKASRHQPDVLYEVLNAKFHKDFARPKDGVFSNLDWKALVIIVAIGAAAIYLITKTLVRGGA